MSPPDLTTRIHQHLDVCELQHGVRVLVAVEAGAVASGTASPDTGHDVRHVYVHSADSYASPWVEERPTTIHATYGHRIAITGMDLRQMVRELANSNPDVIAWLQSPVLYQQHLPFIRAVQALLPAAFCPALAIAHHRQRAWSIQQRHLAGEAIWPAMYLPALVAVLAAAWVARHATPPPLAFGLLLQDAALQPALLDDVQQLLQANRRGAITALAPPHRLLDTFIASELQRDMPNPEVPAAAARAIRAELGRLFLHTLQSLQH